MKIEMLLFAAARELASVDRLIVEVPDGSTVADVKAELLKQMPDLSDLAKRSAFCVGNEYATDDRCLTGDQSMAMIPPVSGG